MIGAKEGNLALECVLCIHYPVQFKNSTDKIQALINLDSNVNAMVPDYAKKLGFKIRKNNVGAQKIDGSILKTYGMVIAGFQVEDKLGRARFF